MSPILSNDLKAVVLQALFSWTMIVSPSLTQAYSKVLDFSSWSLEISSCRRLMVSWFCLVSRHRSVSLELKLGWIATMPLPQVHTLWMSSPQTSAHLYIRNGRWAYLWPAIFGRNARKMWIYTRFFGVLPTTLPYEFIPCSIHCIIGCHTGKSDISALCSLPWRR